MSLINPDKQTPMGWVAIKFFVGLALAAYVVILLKPAFYLRTMDNASPQYVIFELGPPTRETTNDQSQTQMVYRAGHIRPVCVEYVLNFGSNSAMKDWTWSINCD